MKDRNGNVLLEDPFDTPLSRMLTWIRTMDIFHASKGYRKRPTVTADRKSNLKDDILIAYMKKNGLTEIQMSMAELVDGEAADQVLEVHIPHEHEGGAFIRMIPRSQKGLSSRELPKEGAWKASFEVSVFPYDSEFEGQICPKEVLINGCETFMKKTTRPVYLQTPDFAWGPDGFVGQVSGYRLAEGLLFLQLDLYCNAEGTGVILSALENGKPPVFNIITIGATITDKTFQDFPITGVRVALNSKFPLSFQTVSEPTRVIGDSK